MADGETEIAENSSKTISIFVKTPKEKKEIELDGDVTVKTVRQLLRSTNSIPFQWKSVTINFPIFSDPYVG